MSRAKRILAGLAALLIAGLIWLPCLHFFFARSAPGFHSPAGLSPQARRLAARHLQLWTEPQLRERELRKMRASNAEWDFMGRSFLVWSLANMGLREPASREAYLQTMDQITDETLRLEKQEGMYFFRALQDDQFLSSLAATLDFAGFPTCRGGRLKYCASNQVGDAALLYAATLGPLWQKVKLGTKL